MYRPYGNYRLRQFKAVSKAEPIKYKLFTHLIFVNKSSILRCEDMLYRARDTFLQDEAFI